MRSGKVRSQWSDITYSQAWQPGQPDWISSITTTVIHICLGLSVSVSVSVTTLYQSGRKRRERLNSWCELLGWRERERKGFYIAGAQVHIIKYIVIVIVMFIANGQNNVNDEAEKINNCVTKSKLRSRTASSSVFNFVWNLVGAHRTYVDIEWYNININCGGKIFWSEWKIFWSE